MISELVNSSFGIDVTFAQPGVAERAMYFGSTAARLWSGGHESAGVNLPSKNWFLAEGAIGTTLTSTETVPASGRKTININRWLACRRAPRWQQQ